MYHLVMTKNVKLTCAAILLLIAMLLSSCELALGEPEEGTMRVLGIGTAAGTASDDAVDFTNALSSLASRSGRSISVSLIADTDRAEAQAVTSESIEQSIETLATQASDGDITIVYISGQGWTQSDAKSADGKGIIYGAKDARFSSEADYSSRFCILDAQMKPVVYGDELVDALDEIPGTVILITDCDHSGALVGSKSIEVDSTDFDASSADLTANLFSASSVDSSKVQILASARRYQAKAAGKALGDVNHSAFTAVLLEGLGYDQNTESVASMPDACQDGRVSINSLYRFVSDACEGSAETPKMSSRLIDTVLFTF